MATSRINTSEVVVKVNLKKSSSLQSNSLKLKKSVEAYLDDKNCMENNVFQGFKDNTILRNNVEKIRVQWGPLQSSSTFSNAKKRILIFKERGSGPVDVESSDDEDEEESPSASTMALPNSALDGLW